MLVSCTDSKQLNHHQATFTQQLTKDYEPIKNHCLFVTQSTFGQKDLMSSIHVHAIDKTKKQTNKKPLLFSKGVQMFLNDKCLTVWDYI